MVRSIIEASLQLRFLVLIVAAALIAFGVSRLGQMPVDIYPEFDPPVVQVQTEALGLSADEVEALITVPMEADLLNGVAWLQSIQSESVAGLASITLIFEPGTDPIKARQMVQERLTQAHALPNVSTPPVMLQPLSSTSRVLIVGLSTQDLSPIDLGVLARWTIRPRLMGLSGVANVAIWGQRERQLQVQVDPVELQAKGVTLSQVIETTGEALWVSPLSYLEASKPGTAGWIDTPNQRLNIHHLLPITSAADLAKISLVGNKGLLLGDVADVVEDHQPLIGDALIGDSAGLLVVIEKFPGASTLEVTRAVEQAFAEMAPGLKGVTVDTTVFRPASYVERGIGNLANALLVSMVLVALVLGVFFFGWRSTLVSLIAIPVALMVAGSVLYLRSASFNTMVLAGLVIALAAIIDDAIIGVEHIARRLREQRQSGSAQSAAQIVVAASLEMRSPMAYATLILLLAVLPVFFVQGLAGNFLQPLAISYILAIVASLVVAIVLTPLLSLTLLGNAPLAGRGSPLVQSLERGYQQLLAGILRGPRPAYTALALVALLSLALVPFLQVALLPAFKQRDLLIALESAPGTSRPEMNRLAAQASRELRAIAGVRNVGAHVGRAITGDQVVGINSGEIWVSLDPSANYDQTLAAVRGVITSYPGLLREVQTYQPGRLGEALSAPGQDLRVRLYGYDLSALHAKAAQVRQAVAQISGVADARASVGAEEPQLEIEVDLAKAAQYQVKPGDVRRAATTLLSGLQVGNLYEEQKVFDVVVWGKPEIRSSLTTIGDLLIDTPRGPVRLGDLAEIRIVPTPTVIQRDAVSRFVDVGVTVAGRDVGAVEADIRARLAAIAFPLEYHAEVLSVAGERQIGLQRTLLAVAVALLGMFLLLQATFNSWRLATLSFVTMPLALAGGAVGALLSGGALSIGSLFGFLAILGLAVRQGIVTIRHFQRLGQDSADAFGAELVLQGSRERLAPILMTSLATGLALTPFVVLGSIPGLEMVAPMATVILGGLVTTALLNLFIVPTLYLHFGASPAPATARQKFVTAGGTTD